MWKFFFILVYFAVVSCINALIMLHFKRKDAKKCNYNCKECGVWDCMSKECNKKRVEN